MSKKNIIKNCIGGIGFLVLAAILFFTKDYHNVDCKNIWTGQYPGFIAAVKERLTDPNSFEHIKTFKSSNGDMVMDFRSRNGFGGMVRGRASTSFSYCKPIRVDIGDDGMSDDWGFPTTKDE